jgi:hypothetical protein
VTGIWTLQDRFELSIDTFACVWNLVPNYTVQVQTR